MKQLLFVHGRSQQHKDAVALKQEWIDAFRKGLADSGLEQPVPDTAIRFPFYGDTLYEMAQGLSAAEAARIVVKGGSETDPALKQFLAEVLLEIQAERGITSADMTELGQPQVLEKGPLNWGWVQALLEVIDRKVPFASGAAVALGTNDVYQYLDNSSVSDTIEAGIRAAITPGIPTVVVSHSLGTIVAYNLLRREGLDRGWEVPLFVTLGSPLGVNAIRKRLAPCGYPSCAARWFNAFDPRDVVALFPLDATNFPLEPAITNKGDVNNLTSNRHGIAGYLSDREVARVIHVALTT